MTYDIAHPQRPHAKILLRDSRYCLFKLASTPDEKSAAREWRRNAARSERSLVGASNIPTGWYPLLSTIEPLASLDQAKKDLCKWGTDSISGVIDEIPKSIEKYTRNVQAADKRNARYGAFGLYTHEAKNRQLEAIYLQLPVLNPNILPVDRISVMALCFKAPWNRVHNSKTDEALRYQRHCIDLALLIHLIRSYYLRNEESMDSEVAVAWTLKVINDERGMVLSGYNSQDLYEDLCMFDANPVGTIERKVLQREVPVLKEDIDVLFGKRDGENNLVIDDSVKERIGEAMEEAVAQENQAVIKALNKLLDIIQQRLMPESSIFHYDGNEFTGYRLYGDSCLSLARLYDVWLTRIFCGQESEVA